jgi:hypothetical protein
MGWAPRVSIERTDQMLVFMSPVSLVISHQQRVALPPLLQWLLGRETVYGPMDWLAVVLWIMSGALFLGSNGSVHRC